MPRYRKKPVEVDAIQWTGDNETEIQAFTGSDKFNALDDEDRRHCDDPEATAQVFDDLHSTWVLVSTGDYIVKGRCGFYLHDHRSWREEHEPIPGEDETARRIADEIVASVPSSACILDHLALPGGIWEASWTTRAGAWVVSYDMGARGMFPMPASVEVRGPGVVLRQQKPADAALALHVLRCYEAIEELN